MNNKPNTTILTPSGTNKTAGGEPSTTPAKGQEMHTQEMHTDAELVERKRKKPSENDGDTTSATPLTSTNPVSKTGAGSSSRLPIVYEEFFQPQFHIEPNHRIPKSASLFADRPIPSLSQTLVTNTILPIDKSAMTRISTHKRFRMCNSIEKLLMSANSRLIWLHRVNSDGRMRNLKKSLGKRRKMQLS